MIKAHISEIVDALGGTLIGASAFFEGVSTDSRAVTKERLFIALQGERFDAHDFIEEIIERKQNNAFIISRADAVPMLEKHDVGGILVSDTSVALQRLAGWWRSRFLGEVVGITGSNGKTSTKEFVAAALSALGDITKTQGNYNNLIGLPLTVLSASLKDAAWVLEMGMNSPKEIETLARIAQPTFGLITSISEAHLGGVGLGSIEAICDAKAELFAELSEQATALVLTEHPWVRRAAERIPKHTDVYTIGSDSKNDMALQSVHQNFKGVTVTLQESKNGCAHDYHTSWLGEHQATNLALAVSVARQCGLVPDQIQAGLSTLQAMAGRLRSLQGRWSHLTVFDDCYNANEASMRAALQTVCKLARAEPDKKTKCIAVLGDMLELGEETESIHQQVGAFAFDCKFDALFTFGGVSRDIWLAYAKHNPDAGMHFEYSAIDELCRRIENEIQKSTDEQVFILIKGSRSCRLERVVDFLVERTESSL